MRYYLKRNLYSSNNDREDRYGNSLGKGLGTAGVTAAGMYGLHKLDKNLGLAEHLNATLGIKREGESLSAKAVRKLSNLLGGVDEEAAKQGGIKGWIEKKKNKIKEKFEKAEVSEYRKGVEGTKAGDAGRAARKYTNIMNGLRDNWTKGGLIGKAKVAAIPLAVGTTVAGTSALVNHFRHSKKRASEREYSDNSDIEVVKLSKQQVKDANSKPRSSHALGTAALVAAPVLLGTGAVAGLSAKAYKEVEKQGKDLVSKAGDSRIKKWLAGKVNSKNAGKLANLAEKGTHIGALRIIDKGLKFGKDVSEKWGEGGMTRAKLVGKLALPGLAVGAGTYVVNKLHEKKYSSDEEINADKKKKRLKFQADLENFSSNQAATRGALEGALGGSLAGIGVVKGAAAGAGAATLGGLFARSAANRADKKGKSDREILKSASRAGIVGGGLSGAAIGAGLAALGSKKIKSSDIMRAAGVLGLSGAIGGNSTAYKNTKRRLKDRSRVEEQFIKIKEED